MSPEDLAERLYGPELLGGRDLPKALDLALLLGTVGLDTWLGRYRDALDEPLLLFMDSESWHLRAVPTVEVEADGDVVKLDADGLRRWARRITRVVWPEDTFFGLVFMPGILTAWNVDLAPAVVHDEVTAQTARLLQRVSRRRRQSLTESEDRLQALRMVGVDEARRFDPLAAGLIVRGGVMQVGTIDDTEPDLATESVRVLEEMLPPALPSVGRRQRAKPQPPRLANEPEAQEAMLATLAAEEQALDDLGRIATAREAEILRHARRGARTLKEVATRMEIPEDAVRQRFRALVAKGRKLRRP